jgi:hypothetical protein
MKATAASAAKNIMIGMTIVAPLRVSSVARRSTLPAPTNPPSDQSVWNELRIGR